jgi:hypothetical protein
MSHKLELHNTTEQPHVISPSIYAATQYSPTFLQFNTLNLLRNIGNNYSSSTVDKAMYKYR